MGIPRSEQAVAPAKASAPPPLPCGLLWHWQSAWSRKEAGGGSISGNKAPFLPSLWNAWHSLLSMPPSQDLDPRVHSMGSGCGRPLGSFGPLWHKMPILHNSISSSP